MNGIAVIVTARGDRAAARALAADIAGRGWDMRQRFKKPLTSIADAVAMARANGRDAARPAQAFADVADNPGGGGRGNTTDFLRALLAAEVQGVMFGVFIDPALAKAAHAAGEGATFEATLNSQTESRYSKQLTASVTVEKLSDGETVGRRGIWAGRAISIGPSALLRIGGVQLVVGTHRKQAAEPAVFELFGLDLAGARSLVVKSRGHFRAGFDEYFDPENIVEVDAPGLTSPVLSHFDFKGLPRPVYPLDADATWAGPSWA